MEIVKRYLFWCVLAGILVVAFVVHFVIVPPVWSETATLKTYSQEKNNAIRKASKRPSTIRTAKYVQAAKAFRTHLEREEKEILERWKERVRVELPAEFERAPKESLEFDSWLIARRNELEKTAREAGLRLPRKFKAQFLFEGTTTPKNPKEIERRLRQVALVHEIVETLARVRVPVTRYRFQHDMKKPEAKETVNRGPRSLDYLEIIAPDTLQKRKHEALAEAYKLAGAGLSGRGGSSFAEPYSAFGLTVRFTAPFAAVQATLQALESNPRYFAIITRIDTQRVAEAYAPASRLTLVPPPGAKAAPGKAPGSAVETAANTHYEEAPVQVQVQMELLSFDEQAVKKMAALPKIRRKSKKKSTHSRKKPSARKKK